ncbi:DUF711 family protein [Cardiobacteriaceae bacterium TAE3-ERU3]|nr:DUF711 family protein [Cardiobacteriaceae bacterium TAE3-ERU3]
MTSNIHDAGLCRVRIITTFITLSKDDGTWADVLADAQQQCQRIATALQAKGYTVQSMRIVTNPFGEYLDTRDVAQARSGLATLTRLLQVMDNGGMRISFAIGKACTTQEIAPLNFIHRCIVLLYCLHQCALYEI